MELEDVCLSILPYFHAGGLITALVMLAKGVRLIVWSRFEREHFFEIIAKYNVTILSVVPTILEVMSNLDALPDSFRCLRYIFVGGDMLQNESIQKMQNLLSPKQHIVQLFGTTETGVLNFMRPILPQFPPDSCGIPLPGVMFKCSENGELLLKTRTMMQGYHEQKLSDIVDENGWLKTGDLIDILVNGSIKISGRLKDIIKIKGFQVSPYELEQSIQQHFIEIAYIVIFGHDAKLYAMAQLKPNLTLNTQLIIDFVKDNFIGYKHVRDVYLIEELPKTASGKVNRWQTQELFVNNLTARSA